MSTSTVDAKRRVVLPGGCPGDVFDIQKRADGQFLLIRLERPEPGENMSRKACLDAMTEAPLRQTLRWEELREVTRGL